MDCSPQAPLSMGFSRQEYWSGLPGPLPGDLPKPGIKLTTLKFLALANGFFTAGATIKCQQGVGEYRSGERVKKTLHDWFSCNLTLGLCIGYEGGFVFLVGCFSIFF